MMAKATIGESLNHQIGRRNPPPPILVSAVGVIVAFLTLFDLIATVFLLFGFRFVALAFLNMGVFLLNLVSLHLCNAISGGRPPSRRLADSRGVARILVWRMYTLAKFAVFLIGALIILLLAAELHRNWFASPT